MEQHFVTFYSPGTFVAETTAKPVESWDVDLAVAMSSDIPGTPRRPALRLSFHHARQGG